MRLHATSTTDGRLVERAAFVFYTIAALGSSIGQIWVGVVTPPWPPTVPWWLRAILVLPFAVVLDLGGVVTAAFADWRQRTGERAYGWRVLSATWIAVGVAINVVGHAATVYLSVVFGALGSFAYAVWLLHAASRRRDALRAAGKLDDTAPTYGLRQWRREPAVTTRAKALALEHGYRRLESLQRAREQLRAEQRDRALQQLLIRQIKAQHDDTVLASIAATTAPVETLAAALTTRFDTAGWVDHLAAYLRPPASADARVEPVPSQLALPPVQRRPQAAAPEEIPKLDDRFDDGVDGADSEVVDPPEGDLGGGDSLPDVALVPTTPARYQRWRDLWHKLSAIPAEELAGFAQANNVSVRTLQRIRQAGEAGLIDEESPSSQRNRLILVNGRHRHG
jgi:hypothetical protein